MVEGAPVRLLVTGGSGFVGRALIARLLEQGHYALVCAGRRPLDTLPAGCEEHLVGELGPATDWSAALAGVDVVIHSAARVHVMNEEAADPLAEFRRVNVQGTLALARQAVAAGVRRFVFLSSIKVNGEGTEPGRPYTATDTPQPGDDYGVSKLEAERALTELAAETALEVVIIRPGLVYGPGVKANFRAMMSWLSRGVPLPLGRVPNRRSLVAIDNLVDLVLRCVAHPAAAGQVFLVSDGEDLSTTELLQRMAAALDRKALLLPVPASLLALGARLVGKPAIAQRLCGSLQVDIRPTCERLNWHPPLSVDQGLRRAALDFLERT
jgi:nucleoside-diphosphate-sugar epimerase